MERDTGIPQRYCGIGSDHRDKASCNVSGVGSYLQFGKKAVSVKHSKMK